MGLLESPWCRKCRAEDETPAHVLCIPTCFFLKGGVCVGGPEDVGNLSLGAIWIFINPLKMKHRLLYLKTQFVPRSKHFSSRL